MQNESLVPLEHHNRLTAGPAPWTGTRVASEVWHVARAVYGTSTEDDERRVYCTVQAVIWKMAPAAPAPEASEQRLIQQIREVCAETLRVGPGVAVPIPDEVREEMRRFMAGEPNLIERLPFCEAQKLAESGEVTALAAAPAPEAKPQCLWPARGSCLAWRQAAPDSERLVAAPQAQAAGQMPLPAAPEAAQAARVVVDRRDLFDVVRAAYLNGARTDDSDEAALRSDAHDYANRCSLLQSMLAAPAPQAQAAGQELPEPDLHGGEKIDERGGYVSTERGYSAGLVRQIVSAALAQRQPLTDEQIDAMAHKEGDYDTRTCCWSFNGDTDCRHNLTNFARAIEAACAEAWGVKLAATTGGQR